MIGLLGMLIEYLLVRPLYGRSIDDPLLLTFGLSYVLVEGVRIVFGSDGIPFPTPPSLTGVPDLGIGFFPIYRLFVDRAWWPWCCCCCGSPGEDQIRPYRECRRTRSDHDAGAGR